MNTPRWAMEAYRRTQLATPWSPEERLDNDRATKALALKARLKRRLEKVL